MDLSASALFAGLLVSSIGLGLFPYGKRQERPPQLLAGIGMMVLPYVGPSAIACVAIGAALVAALLVALRLGA